MNIIKWSMLLWGVLFLLITACSNSDKSSSQTSEISMPVCTIEPIEPITDQSVTLHAVCSNSDVTIDEATVTLATDVKELAINDNSVDQKITFQHLQPDTTYDALFEIITENKTIHKTISIRTLPSQKCVLSCQKCSQTFTIHDPTSTIVDLRKLCFDTSGQKIVYSIAKTKVHYDPLVDCYEDPESSPFDPKQDIYIQDDYLKVRHMSTCGIKSIDVTIVATSPNGRVSTVVTFTLQ